MRNITIVMLLAFLNISLVSQAVDVHTFLKIFNMNNLCHKMSNIQILKFYFQKLAAEAKKVAKIKVAKAIVVKSGNTGKEYVFNGTFVKIVFTRFLTNAI
jgi:hypothetical protein